MRCANPDKEVRIYHRKTRKNPTMLQYIDYGATARVDFFCLHTHGSILIHGARHKRPSEIFKIKLKHLSNKSFSLLLKTLWIQRKLTVYNVLIANSVQKIFMR